MSETNNLLNNYSKEDHINVLYSNITLKDFNISSVKSSNWTIESNIPYVATSHLLDSYSCLPDRPDMAFTFLWKSINSCYKTIAVKKILNSNKPNERLTDSLGLDYLIEEINNKKTGIISSNYSIIDLLNDYAKEIPLKPLKFLANQILKGYVMEDAGIPNLLIGSTYFSFRSGYPSLFQNIINSYGQAYRAISNPTRLNDKVELNITDLRKSKSIPESLAQKLKDLLVSKTVIVHNSGRTSSYTLTISDKEFLSLMIKTLLYSIRNNSVHGNVVSRLSSDYVSNDSLNTAINIYFLGHVFLSLAFYINNDILLSELELNIENLKILKQINNCT